MRHAPQFIGSLLSLVLLAAIGAGSTLVADEAKKVEGDLKAMQGTWVKDSDDTPDATFTFTGDTLKVSVDGMEYVTEIKVDSKAMPHPSMDLTVKEGPGDTVGKKSKGIYKLDGKKLMFRVTHPGVEARPSDFKVDDPDSILFQLKKEEK